MKLLETYKNDYEDVRDTVINFIYKNSGFDGWMYKPKMCLKNTLDTLYNVPVFTVLHKHKATPLPNTRFFPFSTNHCTG